MTKCSNCDNKGEHKHHVVPKSRGGSDTPSNLVLLCVDCHSKAHDVSFKSDSGIIKDAIKRTKAGWEIAEEWWRVNEVKLQEFFLFLYDEETVLHDFVLSSLELGLLRNDDFYKIVHGEATRGQLYLHKVHKDSIKNLWDTFVEDYKNYD